jgi:hypothetical protein
MAFGGTPHAFALAVCRAGAMGSIAAGLTSAEGLRGLIRKPNAVPQGPGSRVRAGGDADRADHGGDCGRRGEIIDNDECASSVSLKPST